MESERTAQYIDAHGPDEDAIKRAVQWLLAHGDESDDNQHAIIAVNTKSALDGAISNVVGEDVVKQLKKTKHVKLDEGELHLVTKRIDAGSQGSGPALALYPDKDLLDKIDEMREITDVLVVPWNRDEIQFWIDQWGATELGSTSSGTQPSIADPVVKEALESLHMMVNVSSGLTHPSDRSKAIEMFRILHQNGHQFDPTTIRAWLVSEKDWQPSKADQVQEVAEDVLAGKQLQFDSGNWADDILRQWRDAADAEDE